MIMMSFYSEKEMRMNQGDSECCKTK